MYLRIERHSGLVSLVSWGTIILVVVTCYIRSIGCFLVLNVVFPLLFLEFLFAENGQRDVITHGQEPHKADEEEADDDR